MKTTPADRRVRKTQALLRSTLAELLQKKELKNISVSELTGLADMNRGTFYLHYKDIYDLFEQIENEAIEEFTLIIARYKRQEPSSWGNIMLDLFKYIAANGSTFRAILKTGESTFLTKIVEMNRPKTPEEWRGLFPGGKPEYYDYYFAFFTSGCVEMARAWFDKGMPESAEKMARLTQSMMENSIGHLGGMR
ncbi:MAG: TetR/AcrR family transcriptional regulator [Oscillospiraceae bacterium]